MCLKVKINDQDDYCVRVRGIWWRSQSDSCSLVALILSFILCVEMMIVTWMRHERVNGGVNHSSEWIKMMNREIIWRREEKEMFWEGKDEKKTSFRFGSPVSPSAVLAFWSRSCRSTRREDDHPRDYQMKRAKRISSFIIMIMMRGRIRWWRWLSYVMCVSLPDRLTYLNSCLMLVFHQVSLSCLPSSLPESVVSPLSSENFNADPKSLSLSVSSWFIH